MGDRKNGQCGGLGVGDDKKDSRKIGRRQEEADLIHGLKIYGPGTFSFFDVWLTQEAVLVVQILRSEIGTNSESQCG